MIGNGVENRPGQRELSPIADFIKRWGRYTPGECALFAIFNDGAVVTAISSCRSISEGLPPNPSAIVFFAVSIVGSFMTAMEMRSEAIKRDHFSNLK